MKTRIHKKVALITGASSGIGRSTADLLTEQGYTVYGLSRTKPKGKFDFIWIELDITDKASLNQIVTRIIRKEHRVDVLINNAGISLISSVENTSQDESISVMNANFHGSLNMIQAILPFMKEQESGYIINVSSLGGRFGLPFQSIYCASKFALEGMTESLRYEIKEYGIKAVLLEPGDCKTPITSKRLINTNDSLSGSDTFFTRAKRKVEWDEKNGCEPMKVAQKVWKILDKKQPKPRYSVGNLSQRIIPYVKNIIPAFFFEFILNNYYRS